jgi:hypothetical protein
VWWRCTATLGSTSCSGSPTHLSCALAIAFGDEEQPGDLTALGWYEIDVWCTDQVVVPPLTTTVLVEAGEPRREYVEGTTSRTPTTRPDG